MRFLGSIEAKTDAKGRVFLPAVFRKVLQASAEESIVLCKDLFQMDVLRSRLSRWDAGHQQLFRQFVSDVELLSLDGNGRFLIPKRYLQMAEIQQCIKFIGMGDTIEIWSEAHTRSPFMEADQFGKAIEEVMRTTGNKDERGEN